METSSRRKVGEDRAICPTAFNARLMSLQACDLCFKKKIRCDSLKPSCSNCLLYKVPCGTTTIRRRAGQGQPRKATPANPPEEDSDNSSPKQDDTVQDRLARIEAKVDDLRTRSSEGSVAQSLAHEAAHDCEINFSLDDAPFDTPFDAALDTSNWSGPRRRNELAVPPMTEVLPIVDLYFQSYNTAIPLYHQPSFMRMLNEYYSEAGEKSRAIGATINIVLAMGYRAQFAFREAAVNQFTDAKIKQCIDNAQLVLDELMVREEDTLGLQVILGLVTLFQTHADQKASAVLITTAVRLAHRLQLESKSTLVDFPPDEARQRSNVFWICYWLDKDVSLRTATPSMQLDCDIDLDLPGTEFSDATSYLQSNDGLSHLHYLRARVHLAHIEGRIYDTLFSNRSRKQTPEVRQQTVIYLDGLLNGWLQTIPAPLQLGHITKNLKEAPLLHMTALYQTYLICLVMTHGLYSLQAPWLKTLGGLGNYLLRKFNTQTQLTLDLHPPPMPQPWQRCVTTSRESLQVLDSQSYGGCNVWLSSCAYFSALVFLMANLSYFPAHELAEQDRKLAKSSLAQLEKYFDRKGFESYRHLKTVLHGLESMATAGANRATNFTPWQYPEPTMSVDFAAYAPAQAEIFDTVLGPSSDHQPVTSAFEPTWLQGSFDIDFADFDFSDNPGNPPFGGTFGRY
ncbi:Uu.00g106050.m01.CDS01 [Anthostomella pinea]|uniref:Uu.00g106050.m01.CDS01 n=1 Tax=Anthostomella pinea TaxID=933095 RepID=A0AAI8VE31_9PEZI|nr:Uu.00g106050.m01.CDS01 [Anthostomella pinea]